MNLDIDSFLKRSLHFTRGDCLDDVPQSAGVYAWFLPFESDATETLDDLVQSLTDNLRKSVPLTEVEGTLGATSVSIRASPPDVNDAVCADAVACGSLSRRQLEQLSNVLLVLSFLAPPIYVGVARGRRGLKGRLEQHLAGKLPDSDWFGSFRARTCHAIEDPTFLKRCLIAYCCLEGTDLPPEVARLLEHILIRTIKPPQSKRG